MYMLRFFQPAVLAGAVLSLLILSVSIVRASDEPTFDSPYQPSADVMADVDAALAQAREEDKLALIVMGATWCHDSRGLVRRLRDEDIAGVIDERYVTLYVDVAHLEAARDVNKRFGMPAIYATPTVMVVDPETERLTNARTMHQWRDADSISYPHTREYFVTEAETARQSPAPMSAQLRAYYDAIDAFEAAQAARLVVGYDIIGPQLAMGRGNYPDGFEKLWGEARRFRYQLTDDLLALRAKAEELAAAGRSDALVFPSYPALSWE